MASTVGQVRHPIVCNCHIILLTALDHHLQSKLTIAYLSEYILIVQAAIAWGAGEPLSIEDVEVAPPKTNEVRIQIHHTGVCHTGMTNTKDRRRRGY